MKSVVVVVNKWDIIEKDEHTMVDYTRRLRTELNFLDYVPVLFISGHSDVESSLIGLERPTVAFLNKPVRIAQLAAKVEELLATRHSA